MKVLEDRDKSMKAALESRDRDWLNSVQHWIRDSVNLQRAMQRFWIGL